MKYITTFNSGVVDPETQPAVDPTYRQKCSLIENFFLAKNNSLIKRPPLKVRRSIQGAVANNAQKFTNIIEVRFIGKEIFIRRGLSESDVLALPDEAKNQIFGQTPKTVVDKAITPVGNPAFSIDNNGVLTSELLPAVDVKYTPEGGTEVTKSVRTTLSSTIQEVVVINSETSAVVSSTIFAVTDNQTTVDGEGDLTYQRTLADLGADVSLTPEPSNKNIDPRIIGIFHSRGGQPIRIDQTTIHKTGDLYASDDSVLPITTPFAELLSVPERPFLFSDFTNHPEFQRLSSGLEVLFAGLRFTIKDGRLSNNLSSVLLPSIADITIDLLKKLPIKQEPRGLEDLPVKVFRIDPNTTKEDTDDLFLSGPQKNTQPPASTTAVEVETFTTEDTGSISELREYIHEDDESSTSDVRIMEWDGKTYVVEKDPTATTITLRAYSKTLTRDSVEDITFTHRQFSNLTLRGIHVDGDYLYVTTVYGHQGDSLAVVRLNLADPTATDAIQWFSYRLPLGRGSGFTSGAHGIVVHQNDVYVTERPFAGTGPNRIILMKFPNVVTDGFGVVGEARINYDHHEVRSRLVSVDGTGVADGTLEFASLGTDNINLYIGYNGRISHVSWEDVDAVFTAGDNSWEDAATIFIISLGTSDPIVDRGFEIASMQVITSDTLMVTVDNTETTLKPIILFMRLRPVPSVASTKVLAKIDPTTENFGDDNLATSTGNSYSLDEFKRLFPRFNIISDNLTPVYTLDQQDTSQVKNPLGDINVILDIKLLDGNSDINAGGNIYRPTTNERLVVLPSRKTFYPIDNMKTRPIATSEAASGFPNGAGIAAGGVGVNVLYYKTTTISDDELRVGTSSENPAGKVPDAIFYFVLDYDNTTVKQYFEDKEVIAGVHNVDDKYQSFALVKKGALNNDIVRNIDLQKLVEDSLSEALTMDSDTISFPIQLDTTDLGQRYYYKNVGSNDFSTRIGKDVVGDPDKMTRLQYATTTIKPDDTTGGATFTSEAADTEYLLPYLARPLVLRGTPNTLSDLNSRLASYSENNLYLGSGLALDRDNLSNFIKTYFGSVSNTTTDATKLRDSGLEGEDITSDATDPQTIQLFTDEGGVDNITNVENKGTRRAVVATENKVYTLVDSSVATNPIFNEVSSQGIYSEIVSESSFFLGAGNKDLLSFKYYEKSGSFIRGVVNEQYQNVQGPFQLINLISAENLVFMKPQGASKVIHVLTVGNDRGFKGFTTFTFPQDIHHVVKVAAGVVGLVYGDDRKYTEMDFNDLINQDFVDVLDNNETPIVAKFRPLPIRIITQDFSSADNGIMVREPTVAGYGVQFFKVTMIDDANNRIELDVGRLSDLGVNNTRYAVLDKESRVVGSNVQIELETSGRNYLSVGQLILEVTRG